MCDVSEVLGAVGSVEGEEQYLSPRNLILPTVMLGKPLLQRAKDVF